MPATPHDKVLSMVERELGKNAEVDNAILRTKAEKIDPGIKKLSARQFHARYPLQIKRRSGKTGSKPRKLSGRRTKRQAAPSPGRRVRRRQGAPAATNIDRDAVRAVLLDWAQAVSSAESHAELVKTMSNLDRYVDRIGQAAGA